MKKIGVIVCNNGLGHVKRVLNIISFLKKSLEKDVSVFDVFVDKNKLNNFADSHKNLVQSGVNFINLEADILDYESLFLRKYSDYLKNARAIWSDNFTFPLAYNRNTYLSGSFLWHEVVRDKDFIGKEIALLKKYKPVMIGLSNFSTLGVRRYTKFYPVGLYNYFDAKLSIFEKNGILISCGRSESGIRELKNILNKYKDVVISLSNDYTIFIEPEFHEMFKSCDNIKKADFTKKMFEKIFIAIIRPGIGTLSDILAHGGKIFAIKDKNFEIEHNCRVLKKLGIGEVFKNFIDVKKKIYNYDSSEELKKKHFNNLDNLQFSGIEESASILSSLLGCE